MIQESDRDLLVRIDERTRQMHDELLAAPDGRVPKLEEVQLEHSKQINFWRGGLAFLALLILALGSVLLAHVMSGK